MADVDDEIDRSNCVNYSSHMVEVIESDTFKAWFAGLRDSRARARIIARIRRLSLGNPGDCAAVGEGVSEMRIDHGPGYRVYFAQRGQVIALLLCGGDKSTQRADIVKARRIASEWSES